MIDLIDYIDKGGVIVYILIGLNILGFSIMIYKIFVLFIAKENKNEHINNLVTKINSLDIKDNTKKIEILVDNDVSYLEQGLNTIKIIASISPLLGLLGTVIGILQSFEAITKIGLGDPAIFSGGISVALITTVAGLIVAIPHYIGYNYFIGLIDKYELLLLDGVYEQI